jgi:aminoglycoside phosphotransferase (APT) family kinase protein
MHADEVDTDVALVRRLVAAQFPQWAALPLAAVPSAGTDNALYRLGDDLAVRLPRIHWAAGQVEKEQRWLPTLASYLPLAVPVPLAMGMPGEGYPWHWSVYRWLPGESSTIERLVDPRQAAIDLAQFVIALQRLDPTGPTGGPLPGEHNSWRGVPLAARDERVRDSIAALDGLVDSVAVTAAWDAALAAPVWDGPPCWIHGDLQAGNLLAVDGRLSAVIDFGCLGVGDPACDVMVAWEYFTADTRAVFRAALAVDDATWARGRGWALSKALIALPYYLKTSPVIVASARRVIAEVLAD